MRAMHLVRSSRRSRSTILKMRLHHFRSDLTPTHRVKLFRRLISKPKKHTDYVSSWINKWSILHLIILSICIMVHYEPSLINGTDVNIKSSFHVNNGTSIKHEYFSWFHYGEYFHFKFPKKTTYLTSNHNNDLFIFALDWCSSSSRVLNNTNSYTLMNQSVILPILICCVILIIGFFLFYNLNEKMPKSSTNACSLHFWHGLVALSMFVGSSIYNQWISSLICRPVEILYDRTFTSILGVQMLGFILCLHMAYGLGSIFTPLFDQRSTILSSSNSRASSSRSVKNISYLEFDGNLRIK